MYWDIETYVPQTCDDIAAKGDSVEIDDHLQIKSILDYMNSADLIKVSDDGWIDARICCNFYNSNGDKLMTIIFGPPSSLAIDNATYQWDGKLFNLFLDYLPREYKDRIGQ